MFARQLPWAAPAVLLLAGCIVYSPNNLHAGATQADVIAAMGPPTGRYALPQGGARLEFARGPQGRETFMVDFDATGGMTQWQQVLLPWTFSQIAAGTSTEELLMRIGHPAEAKRYPRQQLSVWSYRYPTNDCLWYQVQIGDDGLVIGVGQGIDPQCDAPSDRAP